MFDVVRESKNIRSVSITPIRTYLINKFAKTISINYALLYLIWTILDISNWKWETKLFDSFMRLKHKFFIRTPIHYKTNRPHAVPPIKGLVLLPDRMVKNING